MSILLIGTRKGGFVLETGAGRRHARLSDPHFLGAAVHHMVLDPRDGRTLLAAAKPGHLGPTVYRSADLGDHWQEASRPPAFAKAADPQQGRSIRRHIRFYLNRAPVVSLTQATAPDDELLIVGALSGG